MLYVTVAVPPLKDNDGVIEPPVPYTEEVETYVKPFGFSKRSFIEIVKVLVYDNPPASVVRTRIL